jgi:hypothetical protein
VLCASRTDKWTDAADAGILDERAQLCQLIWNCPKVAALEARYRVNVARQEFNLT